MRHGTIIDCQRREGGTLGQVRKILRGGLGLFASGWTVTAVCAWSETISGDRVGVISAWEREVKALSWPYLTMRGFEMDGDYDHIMWSWMVRRDIWLRFILWVQVVTCHAQDDLEEAYMTPGYHCRCILSYFLGTWGFDWQGKLVLLANQITLAAFHRNRGTFVAFVLAYCSWQFWWL